MKNIKTYVLICMSLILDGGTMMVMNLINGNQTSIEQEKGDGGSEIDDGNIADEDNKEIIEDVASHLPLEPIITPGMYLGWDGVEYETIEGAAKTYVEEELTMYKDGILITENFNDIINRQIDSIEETERYYYNNKYYDTLNEFKNKLNIEDKLLYAGKYYSYDELYNIFEEEAKSQIRTEVAILYHFNQRTYNYCNPSQPVCPPGDVLKVNNIQTSWNHKWLENEFYWPKTDGRLNLFIPESLSEFTFESHWSGTGVCKTKNFTITFNGRLYCSGKREENKRETYYVDSQSGEYSSNLNQLIDKAIKLKFNNIQEYVFADGIRFSSTSELNSWIDNKMILSYIWEGVNYRDYYMLMEQIKNTMNLNIDNYVYAYKYKLKTGKIIAFLTKKELNEELYRLYQNNELELNLW